MTNTGISVPDRLALSLETGSIMADIANHMLPHLAPAAARLGAVSARPKMIAVVCVIVLAGAGWIYLGILSGSSAPESGSLWSWLSALCRPAAIPSSFGMGQFALVALMWSAMALAMMLPSAAPMILTYAEIADTAACKGEHAVSPFVLALGYAAIWIGFALLAALLQVGLTRAGLNLSGADVAVQISGLLFVVAGLYQFSALKQSCLRVCQRPFPFFFANWRTTTSGVFRLGMRQGLHCLGCCWAMMFLMLVAGVMNAVWMAGLGLVMTLEKMTSTPRFSRILGVIFVVVGIAMMSADSAGIGWARFVMTSL
jgi:predicted metal-binding membrane protein